MYRAHTSFASSSLSYTDARIISVNEGDVFFYLGELSNHWWWGRTKQGVIGLLPADHLAEVSVKSRRDATFMIRENFKSAARHEVDVSSGDIVQVIQGNSSLSMWLVKKEDGKVGLVPSMILEAYSSSQQELIIGNNFQSQITNDLRFGRSNTLPIRAVHDSPPIVPPRNYTYTVNNYDLDHLPDQTITKDDLQDEEDSYYMDNTINTTSSSDNNSSINIPDDLLPTMDAVSSLAELSHESDSICTSIATGLALNNVEVYYRDFNNNNNNNNDNNNDNNNNSSGSSVSMDKDSIEISYDTDEPPTEVPDDDISVKFSMQSDSTANSTPPTEGVYNDDASITQLEDNSTDGQPEDKASTDRELTPTEERDNYNSIPSEPVVECPAEMGAYMIDLVRSKTKISYTASCSAVDTILSFIQEHFEGIRPQIAAISKAVDLSRNSEEVVIETQDEISLCENRNMIKELVENYQERGWAVQSDQQEMILKLDSMISLLSEGDPRVVLKIARDDDYSFISNLATFYSTEKRPMLRRKLLNYLSIFCTASSHISYHLQGTTLASYLPNDLCEAPTDLKLCLAACKLSSLLFATGEAIPIDLYDAWNETTICTLLHYIEEPLSVDIDELLPEAAISTILSFNQHFTKNSNNTVLNALSSRLDTSRNFIDIIMLYLNRDINPVPILINKNNSIELNPVQKLLRDLLSTPIICTLFDQTDIQLLFDMFMRKITDIATNSPHIPMLIYILGDVIKTKLYTEIQYRIADVRALFTSLQSSHISSPIKSNLDAVMCVQTDNTILLDEFV